MSTPGSNQAGRSADPRAGRGQPDCCSAVTRTGPQPGYGSGWGRGSRQCRSHDLQAPHREQSGLSVRQHSNHETRGLAGSNGPERRAPAGPQLVTGRQCSPEKSAHGLRLRFSAAGRRTSRAWACRAATSARPRSAPVPVRRRDRRGPAARPSFCSCARSVQS